MTINEKLYREVRCKACRKLICYEYIFAGRIAFSCPRCQELNENEYKHLSTKLNKDNIDTEFGINQTTIERG